MGGVAARGGLTDDLPMTDQLPRLSIVLPARNEAAALRALLPALRSHQPEAEIIVVDDGSTDDTAEVCAAAGVRRVVHPYGMGNGAAIKSGARAARGTTLCFMDADGQHDPTDIARLLDVLGQGFHMVVGARSRAGQANAWRGFANGFYNRFASWMTGRRVHDLTSGFRVVEAARFREFLHLLPNGFSYPTTITMAFLRSGLGVTWEPIEVGKRVGTSHLNPLRDGARFLLIIFKIGTLFSPLKVFLPFSLLFLLAGLGLYAFTFATEHRFTNMGGLLLSNAFLTFLMGLVSEQITALMYRDRN